MYDPNNPYASPTAEIHPVAAQWLGEPSPSLKRVARGLGMILAGNLLYLAVILFLIGAFFVVRDVASLETLFTVLGLGSLVALGLNIAGSLFCLATPSESGAKGMIFVSVTATVVAVALDVAVRIGAVRDVSQQFVSLLNLLAAITFLLFLRLLSRFIGRYDLGRTAASILIWGIISTIAAIAGVIAIIASLGLAVLKALAEHQPRAQDQLQAALQRGAGGAMIGFLVVTIASIVFLVCYIRYLMLLHGARRAILTGGRG